MPSNTTMMNGLTISPRWRSWVAKVEAVVIFGWTEGMTNRMAEGRGLSIGMCTRSRPWMSFSSIDSRA